MNKGIKKNKAKRNEDWILITWELSVSTFMYVFSFIYI